MPVVRKTAVGVGHLAALGYRQEIVAAARAPHIEKVGAPAGFHGLGQNLVSIFLRVAARRCLGCHGVVVLGLG